MLDFLSEIGDGIGKASDYVGSLLTDVIGIGGQQQNAANALPEQPQRPEAPTAGGQVPDQPQRPGNVPINNPAQAAQQIQELHQKDPEFQRAVNATAGIAQQVKEENPHASDHEVSQAFRDRLNSMMADKPWYSSRPMGSLLFNFGLSLMGGNDLGQALAHGAIAANNTFEADKRAPHVLQMAEQAAQNGEINAVSEAALMEYANTGNPEALKNVRMSDLQKMQHQNEEWSRRNQVTFGQSEQQNAEAFGRQREMQQASFANQAALQANSEAHADARAERGYQQQLQMFGLQQALKQQAEQQKEAKTEQAKVDKAHNELEQTHAAFENPTVAAVINGDYGYWNGLADTSAARQSAATQLYETMMQTEMHLNGGKAIPKERQEQLQKETDEIFSRGAAPDVTKRRVNALKMTALNNMLSTVEGIPGQVKRDARAALNDDPDNLKMEGGKLMYKKNGKWMSW